MVSGSIEWWQHQVNLAKFEVDKAKTFLKAARLGLQIAKHKAKRG